jgi:hypothetical protein
MDKSGSNRMAGDITCKNLQEAVGGKMIGKVLAGEKNLTF